MRTFQISIEEYNSMFIKQGGVCAICGRVETAKHQSGTVRKLAVDHNHLTGKIRGLLCGNCNNGLGRFEDNPVRLLAACSYLLSNS